ncbi:MAG: hypothetical protein MJY77_05345 [Bacteroidaceae bacterium]|nr:hypothetical protein [Bacteroidaceae bacterium]
MLTSSEDFVFCRHHHRCQTSYRYSTEDRHRRLPSSRGCRESLRLRRNDTLYPLPLSGIRTLTAVFTGGLTQYAFLHGCAITGYAQSQPASRTRTRIA